MTDWHTVTTTTGGTLRYNLMTGAVTGTGVTIVGNPAPAPRRRRRGDSGTTGMRTITDGHVLFRRNRYHVIALQGEPPYQGELDGMRAIFYCAPYAPHALVLFSMFDYEHEHANLRHAKNPHFPTPLLTRVWRHWVRLDIFEG